MKQRKHQKFFFFAALTALAGTLAFFVLFGLVAYTPLGWKLTEMQICSTPFDELWDGRPVRLLGIRSSKLTAEGEPIQLSIFDLPAAEPDTVKKGRDVHAPSPEKLQKLDAAMDKIRRKYGKDVVHRGSS